jgi:hypothetical protein
MPEVSEERDPPGTFEEAMFRLEIDLWQLFSELEAAFSQLSREIRSKLQQIYMNHQEGFGDD